MSEKLSDNFIDVPIRLNRSEWAFYSRVAQAAQTDMNTVLVVVLALSVTWPGAPTLKVDTPKLKRKKAAKK